MRATVFFLFILILIACNQKKNNPPAAPSTAVVESADTIANFFPVTSFLKGQIYEIKSIGIAPVKKTTVANHTDSAYVKAEDLETVFADFLSPIIDTANLKGLFTEKKFLDQTLNAFTFTYDPAEGKADSFAFRHWDVYVNPETNKVTRIYMIKKAGPAKELQLTWQCGKWCKIVTVNTSGNGSVEKEEKDILDLRTTMTHKEFSEISSTIPVQPGIYKYFNADNELIYVGKAKHLRKRVSSYFNKVKSSYKTAELVNRIRKIEFTIVNNEQDAFFLENSLIKEFQPLFNINLKDDKSYPYIVIKNEPFPRVFLTRKKIKDGSVYLGPFTSVAKVRDLLNFIKQNIQLRTCKLNLSANNIAKGKFKVCLEYHLGNCKGPCEALQSANDYNEGISQLKDMLKGNLTPVLNNYRDKIKEHAANMQFEKAAVYQSKIEHLQQYHARSSVVNTNTGTVDVFTILEEGNAAYVNYLAVNNGSIIQTKTITLQKKLEETAAEVLGFAVAQLRQIFESETKEIILPFDIEYSEPDTVITVPKAGDKKKLLDLSQKNVNHFREELHAKKILKLEDKTDDEKSRVLKQLQIDLHLKELPEHIECFDNSNFQGSYPVAAMVCFKNGEPSKKDYRHFNIKTVEGINDFASMSEVVYRRYKRISEEGSTLPQLVIIDGGKGQLSAAMESIDKLNLRGKLTLVGLAKNQEELFFTGDTASLQLPWDSESLKLIRRIRDEVHRFGITFHRNKRSKGTFKNELEDIKGIGKQTADQLLKEFRSVKKIKGSSLEDIEKLIGKAKANILWKGLGMEARE